MAPERTHLLTVAVEDDFQATALGPVVTRRDWTRLESRVLANTVAALDLIEAHGAGATFFILGWVVEQVPEVVEEIVRRGHEVASKGFLHRTPQSMGPEELGDDARRAKEAIEQAAGVPVHGHRVARGSLGLEELWALRVLAECGFVYDSSFYPRLRSIRSQAWRRFPHIHECGDLSIREFPLSTWGPDALLFPMAGGNYFRQAPAWVSRAALADWERRYRSPFNMYFHVWELDPATPRIARAGRLRRLRQYRNLRGMAERIEAILERHRFQGIGDLLGLEQREGRPTLAAPAPPSAPTVVREERTPVTVVVPCYNEEGVLAYTNKALEEAAARLEANYRLAYVFVDDASTDGTWKRLQELFGARRDCHLIQQPRNGGVASAIMTGIRAAETELVASVDCDCTYDPGQLVPMLALLEGDPAAMVTASPYHPKGRVVGVPGWRLLLSRGLSSIYRRLLPDCPATVTSCFRVYRRSRVEDLEIENGGFLGVAEILAVLALRGERILEHPAVLESRLLGESKMKLLRTIAGHLGLLARLLTRRIATAP
ncbi:MAG: hypothetical protein CL910_20155 [Deltaproteobacteria bacterium]|nr:hypothetical protein [Deltaproteobacteria bacterium]